MQQRNKFIVEYTAKKKRIYKSKLTTSTDLSEENMTCLAHYKVQIQHSYTLNNLLYNVHRLHPQNDM